MKYGILLLPLVASASLDISGSWLNTGKVPLQFEVQQKDSQLLVTLPEMAPEIYAALGGKAELSGAVIAQGGRRFQAEAHLEKKGLSVWNGKDTCDILYSLQYSGEVHKHPPHKTWLDVQTCSYHERISCTVSGLREQTYDCKGSWISVEEPDSCSQKVPRQSGHWW